VYRFSCHQLLTACTANSKYLATQRAQTGTGPPLCAGEDFNLICASPNKRWQSVGQASHAFQGEDRIKGQISFRFLSLISGRKGGPATLAVVGDGGRTEVIERKDGSIQLTPTKDTLTFLNKDDKVHSSIAAYKRSIRNNFTNVVGDSESNVDITAAIKEGFRYAKIENKNTINVSNDSLIQELWVNRQINF